MRMQLSKQDARKMVREAAISLEKGEINPSQFRTIVVHGMAGEIRSTFAKKATSFNKKYTSKRK
jgi:hypothetical protein